MRAQEAIVIGADSFDNLALVDPKEGASHARESCLLLLKNSNGVPIAVAPGCDVGLHRITIPTKSDTQARRAAPFVIEDDIAADPDIVHVAVGAVETGDSRLVGVVDHTVMASWVEDLERAKWKNATLVPEPALISTAPDELVIVDRGETVVAAFGRGEGFAIEYDLFLGLIGDVCTENTIKRIRIYSDRSESLIHRIKGLHLVVDKFATLSDEGYQSLLVSGADEPPLNLLQGRYGVALSIIESLKNWIPTAYIAAAVLVSSLALAVFEGVFLREEAGQLQLEVEAIFRTAMPDVNRIVNPRAQIEARVQSIQSSNGDIFLALSTALFESLSNSRSGSLESLQFDGARVSLTASLSLQDYAEIEQIRTFLEAKGYSFQEGNSRSEGGRVVSDVKVSLP